MTKVRVFEILVVVDQNPLFFYRFLYDIVIIHASGLIKHRKHDAVLIFQPRKEILRNTMGSRRMTSVLVSFLQLKL